MNKNLYFIILLLAAALVAVSIRFSMVNKEKPADGVSSAENVIENIMTRVSVRRYSGEPVPDSIRTAILKAGMAAPTAANQQAWEFVVITDRAIKDSISNNFQYAKMVKNSDFAVVVCGNMDLLFAGDRREAGNWLLDCSCASENMLLAAHAYGVGGVWCGVYPEEDRMAFVVKVLNLPSNLVPVNILSFGYPEAASTPKDKWDPAKVHYNAF